MDKYSKMLFLCCMLSIVGVQAQDLPITVPLQSDSSIVTSSKMLTDTLHTVSADSLKADKFKPDVKKVLWMGVIIPGYGQILNKRYWKLPIVYGSFLGCAYAISWNSNQYQSYRTAYRDITDNDPSTNSHIEILPKGYTVQTFGGTDAYTTVLKKKQDSFRRYRDLSIFMTVGVYALSLIDAYVDAQLYDFDISPDLSMRIQPALFKINASQPATLAMQCSFHF